MRIRRNAARTLGSAASAAAPLLDVAPQSDLLKTPPPPHLAPCSAREFCGGGSFSSPDSTSGKCCDFNRSCWDVIDELDGSDPQAEDEHLDKYLVHATIWLFSAIVPAVSAEKKELAADTAQLQPEVVKKAAMSSKGKKSQEGRQAKKNLKVGQAKKNAKIKQEEGGAEMWICKKNDGKGRDGEEEEEEEGTPASSLEALHWLQAATEEEEEEALHADFNATEGFYYYAGFGFRSKRHYRSSSVDDSVPTKQVEEEDSIKKEEEQEQPKDSSHPSQVEADEGHGDDQTAARGDALICDDDDISGITGVDENSSDDDRSRISVVGSSMDGNGDPQASNGGSKRKIQRKPVKACSIMSMM
ncbi:unnamed protein product [Urochloa decumbens]|uniref:Uncharacterized protein n=1 Tax=Urochloa decumbens TaxID=240449 RepID=A0ABC8WY59_9POAL